MTWRSPSFLSIGFRRVGSASDFMRCTCEICEVGALRCLKACRNLLMLCDFANGDQRSIDGRRAELAVSESSRSAADRDFDPA
jgi:hypothetical protein